MSRCNLSVWHVSLALCVYSRNLPFEGYMLSRGCFFRRPCAVRQLPVSCPPLRPRRQSILYILFAWSIGSRRTFPQDVHYLHIRSDRTGQERLEQRAVWFTGRRNGSYYETVSAGLLEDEQHCPNAVVFHGDDSLPRKRDKLLQ
jgi:hypothetical protein